MSRIIDTKYVLPDTDDTRQIVIEAMEEARKVIPHGKVATYIPELGKADPSRFGVVLYGLINSKICLGDYDVRFTMQSISKLINLCVALEMFGPDIVFSKVGAEPSGEAFNSLVELDTRSNKPFNPMVNSGAIAIVDLILPKVSFDKMLAFAKEICVDDEITLNHEVFESEMATCQRNKAIAYLLQSKGIVENDVDDVLELYTKLCALNVTAESLANFAKILASDGVCQLTGRRHISSQTARIVKTLMLTCGMYDGSGTFAVKVGIPTKSGVGGGLLAVSDKRAGIGVFSPSLDEQGNSIAGCEFLSRIAKKLKLTLFFDPEWEKITVYNNELG